jgi:parallel beta-helix repeat protein
VVAGNEVSRHRGQGISLSGSYTRNNRIERNRASGNGDFDIFVETFICRADVGNVWLDNQGRSNCALVR